MQGNRNAGGAGVSVAIHILIKFCRVGVQVLDTMVNNAAIGLMADDPRQVSRRSLGLRSSTVCRQRGMVSTAKRNTALPSIVIGAEPSPAAGPPAWRTSLPRAPNVTANGTSSASSENSRTSAIPEQHAGCAVGRVHHAGKCFAPDDERIASAQGVQQPRATAMP